MPRASTRPASPRAPSRRAPSPHDLYRAFADLTRLRILALLHDRELCVGDLVEVLAVPQPTASRHLAELRRAGLVQPHRHGTWVFYTLVSASSDLHQCLLDSLACCFDELPRLRHDRRDADRLAKRGGCCPRPPGTEP